MARERKKTQEHTVDEGPSPISKCSQVNLDTVREKHNQRKRVGERESERKKTKMDQALGHHLDLSKH